MQRSTVVIPLSPPHTNDSGCDGRSSVKIAALNVEGVSTNIVNAQQLAAKHDILAISEHWLWTFEENQWKHLFPEFTAHSHSHD